MSNPVNPPRGRIYDSIVDTIGATPLVRFKRLAAEAGVKADIVGKLEFFNPLSSVKDRIGLAMIESLAIYCLVIVLIILFRNPLLEYLLK